MWSCYRACIFSEILNNTGCKILGWDPKLRREGEGIKTWSVYVLPRFLSLLRNVFPQPFFFSFSSMSAR
jgi:hypothetical protein